MSSRCMWSVASALRVDRMCPLMYWAMIFVIALYVVGGISSPWGADVSSHVLGDDLCYRAVCGQWHLLSVGSGCVHSCIGQ